MAANNSPLVYTFGLIGYPLGHSISPQIHGAALHALGISGEYSLYPSPPHPSLPSPIGRGDGGEGKESSRLTASCRK